MLRFTPTIEELLPNYEIKCAQPGCPSTFINMGNYNMHLIRHHKMPKMKDDMQRLYHCPEEDCPYNATLEGARHFKTIKYLRQHYQKVHLEKKHTCDKCCKSFSTIGQLLSHAKKECGRKFICKECNWEYETMEALLTHGKRKGHMVRDEKHAHAHPYAPHVHLQLCAQSDVTMFSSNALPPDPKPPPIKVKRQDKLTQTTDLPVKKATPMVSVQTVSVQTDPLDIALSDILAPTPSIDTEGLRAMDLHDFTDLQSSMQAMQQCDNGTQTEVPFDDALFSDSISKIFDVILSESTNMQTQTCETFLSESSTNIQTQTCDNFLAESINMHTQTCDDFLSQLGLADIQTQTIWSTGNDEPEDRQPYAAAAANFGYDDLLVSTETQTSFTQCLFDACVKADVEEDSLYTQTQCTQTCNDIFEALLSNGQENDLMSSYHSTYTQT